MNQRKIIEKEPSKAEIRKQQIIDVSFLLFSNQGFHSTKITNITNYLNIAKGTFYYYFSSKEDVLSHLVEYQIEDVLNKISKIPTITNNHNQFLHQYYYDVLRKDNWICSDKFKTFENQYIVFQYISNYVSTICPVLMNYLLIDKKYTSKVEFTIAGILLMNYHLHHDQDHIHLYGLLESVFFDHCL